MAKVNVNTATREELMEVAGLKPGMADAVLKHREEHGEIADLDALREVPRMTANTLDQLRDTLEFGVEAAKETAGKAADAAVSTAKKGAEGVRQAGEKTAEVTSMMARTSAEATQRVMSRLAEVEKVAAERSSETATELSELIVELMNEQLQANIETLQALARTRSWREAIEIQNDFFRGNIERMTHGASRYVETLTRLMTTVVSTGRDQLEKAA